MYTIIPTYDDDEVEGIKMYQPHTPPQPFRFNDLRIDYLVAAELVFF